MGPRAESRGASSFEGGQKKGGGTPVRKPTGTTEIRKKNRKADAPEARVVSQF